MYKYVDWEVGSLNHHPFLGYCYLLAVTISWQLGIIIPANPWLYLKE
jgi:hypothetical protein